MVRRDPGERCPSDLDPPHLKMRRNENMVDPAKRISAIERSPWTLLPRENLNIRESPADFRMNVRKRKRVHIAANNHRLIIRKFPKPLFPEKRPHLLATLQFAQAEMRVHQLDFLSATIEFKPLRPTRFKFRLIDQSRKPSGFHLPYRKKT